MRLKKEEISTIKKCTEKAFGRSEVYLFGSRVDDTARGGDIDLYIVPENRDNLPQKKISFLVTLKQQIGDQKIDLIIAEDKERAIEKEALATGVKL